MLARLFISFLRLANQLYTFSAVTRSNSDSLQPGTWNVTQQLFQPFGKSYIFSLHIDGYFYWQSLGFVLKPAGLTINLHLVIQNFIYLIRFGISMFCALAWPVSGRCFGRKMAHLVPLRRISFFLLYSPSYDLDWPGFWMAKLQAFAISSLLASSGYWFSMKKLR